jgi:hypothetical protein
MTELLKKCLSLCLCISLVACSTLRDVPDWRNATITLRADGLRVGDEVRVSTKDSGPITLTITAIEPDALVGTTAIRAAPSRIAFEQIVAVERSQLDGMKSATLVLGVALVSVLFALKNAAFFPPAY